MQAVRTLTNGTSGQLYHLANRTNRAVGNRQKEKNRGSFGSRNAFLSSTFAPIYTQQFVCDWHAAETNYITQENYHYLRDSYFRYACLLNKVPHHQPGKSVGEGIYNLYHEMQTLIGNQVNLNLEIQQEKLCFRLWQTHKWGEYTLYWFPVKFIESLSGKLRRIAITFLHELIGSNGLDTLYNSDELEYMLEIFANDIEECDDKANRRSNLTLLHAYTTGKAYKLLRRVEQKAYYKNLPSALRRYVPHNDFEKTLIGLIQEGLQFIGKDKPSIVGYSYDPYYDEHRDFMPMEIGQQVRVIYDADDTLNEYMTEYFNMNCRESYELVPTTTLDLSPDTEALFAMDDYPERFFHWADRFTYHIC